MRLSDVLSRDSTRRSSTTPDRFSTRTNRRSRTRERARSRRRPPSRNIHAGSRSMFSADTPARARSDRWSTHSGSVGRRRTAWAPSGGSGRIPPRCRPPAARCRPTAARGRSRRPRRGARGWRRGCPRSRRRRGGPAPSGRSGGRRRPGGPGVGVRCGRHQLPGVGGRLEPRHGTQRGQQDLEGLRPTVVARAERLVEAGQDRPDEPDDEFGVFGAAAECEQSGGHPAGERRRQFGYDNRSGPGPGRRQPGLCCSAGSADVTHVSLLVPSPRLAITRESASTPTRVSPPGRRRKARAPSPTAVSSATAKVRRTTGRGTRAPSSATVGMVEGSRTSCPTQSPGRDRTRSARASLGGRRQAPRPHGPWPSDGRTGSSRRSSKWASTWLRPSGRPHHQLSGPRRASSSPSRAGAASPR